MPEGMRVALDGFMANVKAAATSGLTPQLENIIRRILPRLELCEDYRSTEARLVVDAALWQLLRFLEYRMDTTRANDPSGAYLFADTERVPTEKAAPQDTGAGKAGGGGDKRDFFEKQLQIDCMRFLNSGLGNCAKLEPIDIAGGRADIKVERHLMRVTIEVKREDRDASHEALRKRFGAQATEYSNTSARIGFLLVLDRSRKDGTAGHIEDKVDVTTIPKSGDKEPRTLIIVVMPGRRKTPSQLVLHEDESPPVAQAADPAGGAVPAPPVKRVPRRGSRAPAL